MRPLAPFLLIILISVSALASESSTLNWGPQKTPGFASALKSILVHAQEAEIVIIPLEKIYSEGLVASDPRKVKSLNALKSLPHLMYWAICGKEEPDTKKRQACVKRAQDGILAWVNTYKTDGNPINEMKLFPLFFAIEKSLDGFPTVDQTKIKTWLKSIYDAELHHFDSKKNSKSFVMNHQTWSLSVRAITAKTLKDQSALSSLKDEYSAHVKVNIPSEDGQTNDFEHRDALHYQIYDLEAYVWTALFVPEVLSPEAQKKILQGILFIKPFFQGTKKHIEFAKSKVGFDKIRRDAGEKTYQIKPWDPESARSLLFLARSIYPEIRKWTESVADEKYSPDLKFIAASHML